MATHFGWRAFSAVIINAAVLTVICRKHLLGANAAPMPETGVAPDRAAGSESGGRDAALPLGGQHRVPYIVMAVHLVFLVGIVLGAHHPAIFLGLLMLFIGYAEAYRRFKNRLMIREEIGRASCRERVCTYV